MLRRRSLLQRVVLVLALAIGAGEAGAFSIDGFDADYVDIDKVGVRISSGQSVSGQFDITIANTESDDFSSVFPFVPDVADVVGFDPASQDVTAARLSFLFIDDFDLARDVATIEFGPGVLQQEHVGPYIIGFALPNIAANVRVVTELDETGTLEWRVRASNVAGNDFKVAYARLEAVATAAHAPEPNAAALFAVGALVVARAGRSRRPRAA
jgi:hypothetical protein